MANDRPLYLFDFDGTLTRSDTLIAFLRHEGGTYRLLAELLLLAPCLVLMKLGLYSNHKAKQRLFARYFRGMALSDFDARCQVFAHGHRDLLRPEGIATLRRALADGADAAIVSASVDNWVRPFFDREDTHVRILGTQVETRDGRLTGRFATPNCYGAEKVRRIREAFPDADSRRIVAFGDSRGDREMLQLAQESHFKPFRQTTE